jgi:hypothetical protein
MTIDDAGKTGAPNEGQARVRDLPPPDSCDPVIEVYKKDIDRTLLRENLRLTPAQRAEKFARNMRMVFELRRAVDEGARSSAGER